MMIFGAGLCDNPDLHGSQPPAQRGQGRDGTWPILVRLQARCALTGQVLTDRRRGKNQRS